MSVETQIPLDSQTQTESPQIRRGRKLAKPILAAAGIGLALVAGIALTREGEANGKAATVPVSVPEDLTPTSEAPSEFPTETPNETPREATQDIVERLGGRRLSAEDWEQQISSTVLIEDTRYYDGYIACNGAKTTIDGKDYIVSARHCVDTDDKPLTYSSPDVSSAENVTSQIDGKLYVLDPDTHERIAELDQVVVGSSGSDIMVASTAAETQEYLAKQSLESGKTPRVGDEVAVYAAAGAGNHQAVRVEGCVFLGSYYDGGSPFSQDVIGCPDGDMGKYMGPGFSGHVPTSAEGSMFGPVVYSLTDATSQQEIDDQTRNIKDQLGIDLAAEGFQSTIRTISLLPGELSSFAEQT